MKLLGRRTTPVSKPRQSLWRGPQIDGITYSMLCKWLQCRERFRLKVCEGWSEPHVWNYHIEYGSMFHTAEEAHEAGKDWEEALVKYYRKLLETYPANESDIRKWYLFCDMQFRLYIKYWEKHETEIGCRSILQEQSFEIPLYQHTKLRGKIDSAFERKGFIYIQENKTKGEIDAEGISAAVDQNLQTCIYHLAFRRLFPEKAAKVSGTVYNVIRRPLSDRNAPRQKKKESLTAFIARVGEAIEAEPSKHFYRWTVPMTQRHLDRFCRESLGPILNQVHLWWEGFQGDPISPESVARNLHHFRFPFGVYHSMERGYRGDFFDYYTKGTTRGLERVTNLFPEL